MQNMFPDFDDKIRLLSPSKSFFHTSGALYDDLPSSCVGQAHSRSDFSSFKKNDLPVCMEEHKLFREKFWGDYILITRFADNKMVISRSPTCQIPFFFILTKEKNIIFSNELNLLLPFTDGKFELNFNYMLASLYDNTLLGQATAFNNVYELPLGCEIIIKNGGYAVSPWWEPEYFTKKISFCDPSEVIYNTLETVIKTKLKHTEAKEIFLDFSGGVDSTALHFILQKNLCQGQTYYPMHVYNEINQASNERKMAREIVNYSKLDQEMLELNYLEFLPCAPPSLSYKPSKPSWDLMYYKQYKRYYDTARSKSSNEHEILFVNGHGGDNLLMSFPYFYILDDYLFDKGIKGFGKYATDFAAFFRTNYYEVIASTIKGICPFLTGCTIMGYDPYFKAPWLEVNPLKLKESDELKHPIFRINPCIMPGKQRQIMDLYEVLFLIYSPHIRNPGNYTFYPFISQIFIELMLSIPTYELFQNNIDRYPLRKAISDRFNRKHIWRTDKGEFSNINMLGIKQNYDYVMDLVQNGYFVKNNVINKSLLEDSINDFISGDESLQWPLLRLVNLEMFIECWK